MIRTATGAVILILALALAASGVNSWRKSAPPAEDELIEVTGPAEKISEKRLTARGRTQDILEFSVGGKNFSCGDDKGDFQALVRAARSGKPLSVGLDPDGSAALIGSMSHYYRIRQGDTILVPYGAMVEQQSEGSFAVMVGAIAVACCMCVPAFQFLFGRLSARANPPPRLRKKKKKKKRRPHVPPEL